MGQWNISIHGAGSHHNLSSAKTTARAKYFLDTDVDALFHDFVQKLEAAGHSVSHAVFTHGAAETHGPA